MPTHSRIYLHGHEHLVLGRAEVVALSQEDLSKSSLAQFSLQHDVPSLDVLHICSGDREEAEELVLGSCKDRKDVGCLGVHDRESTLAPCAAWKLASLCGCRV